MVDRIDQTTHNQDRMRRAHSWLSQSVRENSTTEKFIFQWIAFSAAYGSELKGLYPSDGMANERSRFNDFLNRILEKDTHAAIRNILVRLYEDGLIKELLCNQFVFDPYWKTLGQSDDWRNELRRSNRETFRSIRRIRSSKDGLDNVQTVLEEVFRRLYTLRNQIFHGGTTYRTGLGRKQIDDGSRIMSDLLPAVIEIMNDDIQNEPYSDTWGWVAYPGHVGQPI